jgi:tripartite-type tricarboxylate transporter receptor subunit TctC
MSDQLGQQIFIDNRGGAGGTLGTDFPARSAPDGYTLVMHTISSAVLNKFLYTRVKLDVSTTFAPISQIGIVSQLLAVNGQRCRRKICANSSRWLKANPGKYHYGSSGLGAIMHLGGELFSFMTETNGGSRPLSGRRAGDGRPPRRPHSISWWPAFPRSCRISAPANCALCA